MIVGAIRRQLVARAEARRQFPRAVIDRGLVDLLVPISERTRVAREARVAARQRGRGARWADDAAVPALGGAARATRVDLDLSVALFDADWRHVGTCDFTNLVVGDGAATHSGDLTYAPAPLGASEFVDLHLERLAMLGARHRVMVVFSYNDVPFDKLAHGFAGLMHAPAEGQHFDPRAVTQRFDLRGGSVITVPLTIDLAERRLRWLDVHIREPRRAARRSAAIARRSRTSVATSPTSIGTHSRPTMWDVACIHAAARATSSTSASATARSRRIAGATTRAESTRLARLLVGRRRRRQASPRFPRPTRRPGSRSSAAFRDAEGLGRLRARFARHSVPTSSARRRRSGRRARAAAESGSRI